MGMLFCKYIAYIFAVIHLASCQGAFFEVEEQLLHNTGPAQTKEPLCESSGVEQPLHNTCLLTRRNICAGLKSRCQISQSEHNNFRVVRDFVFVCTEKQLQVSQNLRDWCLKGGCMCSTTFTFTFPTNGGKNMHEAAQSPIGP